VAFLPETLPRRQSYSQQTVGPQLIVGRSSVGPNEKTHRVPPLNVGLPNENAHLECVEFLNKALRLAKYDGWQVIPYENPIDIIKPHH